MRGVGTLLAETSKSPALIPARSAGPFGVTRCAFRPPGASCQIDQVGRLRIRAFFREIQRGKNCGRQSKPGEKNDGHPNLKRLKHRALRRRTEIPEGQEHAMDQQESFAARQASKSRSFTAPVYP